MRGPDRWPSDHSTPPTRSTSPKQATSSTRAPRSAGYPRIRKAQGLTLKQVATAAQISVGYLSEIERNLTRVPIGVLKSLCDVFGIHMNWFFPPASSVHPKNANTVVRGNNHY